MAINLGDINFGLGADTARLEAARKQILAFGRDVEKAASSQAEGARKAEAAMRRQETAILSGLQKVLDLNNTIRKFDGNANYLNNTSAAFTRLIAAIGQGPVSALEFQRGMVAFEATIKNVSRDLDAMVSSSNRAASEIKNYEGAIFRAESSVIRFDAAVQRLKATQQSQFAGRAAAALAEYRSALDAAGNSTVRAQAATQQFQRTMQGLGIELQNIKAKQRAQELSGIESALRRLSDISILLHGPLSGIATRLTLIASVSEHVNMSTAAFVVGITAAAAVVTKLGTGSIDATRNMQKIDQALISLSGNSGIAAQQVDYLRNVADRAGADFFTVAKAFTRLEAASQGTNLQGEKTTKIFENILFASQKLGSSQEELAGVLKAVEQIMSKGKVQAEELRGQLGDRMPGAVNIMAQALNVSTEELNKMMEQGKLTSDVLEAFAEMAVKRLGIDTTQAINNTVAAEARLGNAMTFFYTNVDKAVGFTDAYINVLNGLAGAVDFVSNNITTFITVLGGLAGAAGAAMLMLYGPTILAGIASLGTALRAVTAGIWMMNAALMANPLVAVTGLLVKLGVVALGAFAGYSAMSAAISDSGDKYRTAAQGVDELIAAQERLNKTVPEQNQGLIDAQHKLVQETISDMDILQKKQAEAQAYLDKVTAAKANSGDNKFSDAIVKSAQDGLDKATSAYEAGFKRFEEARNKLSTLMGINDQQTTAALKEQGDAVVLWSDKLGEIRTKLSDNLALAEVELQYGKESTQYAAARADQEWRTYEAKALQENASQAQINTLRTIFQANQQITAEIERRKAIKEHDEDIASLQTELRLQEGILALGTNQYGIARLQAQIEKEKLATQMRATGATENQVNKAMQLVDQINRAKEANAAFAARAGDAIGSFQQILGIVQNIASVLGSIGMNTVGLKAQAEALAKGASPTEATISGKVAQKSEELRPLLQSGNVWKKIAGEAQLKSYNAALQEEAKWQGIVNEKTAAWNKANKSSGGGGGGGSKQRNTFDDATDSLRELDAQLAIYQLPKWQRAAAERQAEVNAAVDAFKDKLTRANIPQAKAVELVEQYRQKMTALKEAEAGLDTQINMWDTLSEKLANGMDQALSNYVDAIMDGKDALKSLLEVGKSVAADLLKTFMQLAWLNPLKNWLFGGDPTTGGLYPTLSSSGGLFADLISAFGGGKATGGPLAPGKWYVAGENGPEPIWGGGAGATAVASPDQMPESFRAGSATAAAPKVYVNISTQPGETVDQTNQQSDGGMTDMQNFIINTVNQGALAGKLQKGVGAAFGLKAPTKVR